MPRFRVPSRVTVFITLVSLIGALLPSTPPAAASVLPAGFSESVVLNGLTHPTVVRFSPDGRVFVAEKSGLIKVFDSLSDPTPTVFADLSTNVYNYWDRGMLGMALDPNFPTKPYVYVLYAYDAAIGGTAPRWGTPGVLDDPCPNPPGVTTGGCVISGRLSRLQASGDVMVGPEQVLIENWCQQFPSHSIGSIEFGADGALYVSGGDGASFDFTDWGQNGVPLVNPCGDPPGPPGTNLTPPTAEGGALRAQDLQTAGDPVGLNGTILRVDPDTGAGMAGNPLIGNADPNAQRIIGYGNRNPFRIALRPGTNDVWIGDVGWSTWEEIDRISNYGGPVENFGWPCYEGPNRQPGYDGANLNICENLYAQGSGAVTAPVLTYNHSSKVVPGESCPTGSSSISGLAFYQGGDYPIQYANALFFADYSRDCIWVMYAGADGLPNPGTVATFAAGANNPVGLQIGPGGDLYYVDFDGGAIWRVAFSSTNQPPTAAFTATPESGSPPLTVALNGAGSSDPDPGDTLSYAWDLDNDGAFDDANTVATSTTFTTAGVHPVRLRVTDGHGAFGDATKQILVDATPPVAVIDTPLNGATWKVGDVIPFSGHATDAEEGTLPAADLTWSLIMHHCPSNCHTHPIQAYPGVASGSFSAPDHEYPSYLELRLVATDATGLTSTASVQLDPLTVDLSFATSPSGLQLAFNSGSLTAPATKTVIKGSANTVSALTPQTLGGTAYGFSSWSDGGAQTHVITANASATYTATYTASGQTQTLTPTDDAYISEGAPNSNYGNLSTLRVRASATAGGSYRSYLKFNVAGLSAPPARVRLRLFVTDPSPAGGGVYGLSASWSEATITWNNAPPITGSSLGSLGNVVTGTWVELDVTSTVTGNGTYSFGIKDGVDNSAIYSSSEGTNSPQLVVEPGGGGPTAPTADFSATPLSGAAPLDVAFSDASSGAPTSWAWDFDNNGTTDSTTQNPHHIYSASGTYSVKLTATNAQGSDVELKTGYVTVSSSQPQTLTPTDDAYISEGAPNSNYGNLSTLRVRASATAGGSYRSYLKFNVAGLSAPPARVRLRLFVTDPSPAGGGVYGLSASWSEATITWNNAPPITGSSLGSLGNVVTGTWVELDVTSTVTGNGTYSFGIKDGVDNSAIYSSSEGTNSPQLVVEPGGGGPTAPTADFSATPLSGAAPLDVAFSDASSGAPTSWAWDFDNNGTTDSTTQNPHYIYSASGTYSVKLTATNAQGSDVELKTGYVTVSSETVLVGAGDIARCTASGDEGTAAQIAAIGGTVFTVGDNAYPSGSATDFANCYDPSWGQHKARTMPAVGDDDYLTAGAAGYFGYFGAAAGDPAKGYYSYDRGTWHIVVLNSDCTQIGGCAVGSPEELWLRADLAAHQGANVLAYFHDPLFTSGSSEGPQTSVGPFWNALYEFGADVVVNANEHSYERFAPQTPTGGADGSYGIREFVVGTGGGVFTNFGTPAANSEVRNNTTYGVLKLTLADTSYSWQFVPASGGTFTDSGTTATHGAPPTGQVITLTPTDDSRVAEEFPNTNYGNDVGLRLRNGPGVDHNSYLKFDVSGLSGAPTSVTLRLYVTDASPDGGTLYSVTSAWSEATITWNNAPAIGGTALRSLGKVTLGTWAEVDLTPYVTGNGVYAFGITNSSNNSAIYSSSEGANPPQLVITTN